MALKVVVRNFSRLNPKMTVEKIKNCNFVSKKPFSAAVRSSAYNKIKNLNSLSRA
jgi:non-canonical (house-cleaning) NTP pyrophosphatase